MIELLRRLWHFIRGRSSSGQPDMPPTGPAKEPSRISVGETLGTPSPIPAPTPNEEPPLSLATLQRTYTGLLDDVMIRYSDDYVGEKFFNKMILKNIVFGGGIFMNDGYLVNHETARAHLYNDDSLLRVMLATNFIRVLTRENSADGLANMPQKMADSGNTSFNVLCTSNEWREFGPLFRRLAEGFFHTNNARSWPRFNMSHGFTKLIRRVFIAQPHELGLTRINADQLKWMADAFEESSPLEGNPRHKYEEAAKVVLKDRVPDFREAMRQVMDLGNQAYHYNFGLTLTDEEPNGVSVDTTMGQAFDEFLKTTEIESGQLAAIPLIEVPEELPFEHGDIFRPFLDQTTQVGQAKIDYLRALRALLAPNARNIADLQKDVQQATEQYIDRMKTIFRTDITATTGASVTFARGIWQTVSTACQRKTRLLPLPRSAVWPCSFKRRPWRKTGNFLSNDSA